MTFTSISFLMFLFAVFLIYWGIPHKFRYILLICANILFCFSFGAKALIVLLFVSTTSYVAGRLCENEGLSSSKAHICGKFVRFSLLLFVIVFPLLVFKYLDFVIYSIDKVLSKVSLVSDTHTLGLIAPIGISFYTFESISYVADVYNKRISAEKNYFKLFSYISFFPSITSGPIERADHFFNELDKEKIFNYGIAVSGLRLMLLGMVKKICGADVLKQYVDAVFGNVYAYKGPVLIIAILLYTYEIYLDFSGYTDMARGAALLLGIELPVNFSAPYLSGSIKEFFGKWHISLSTWLKDYIYIPLGGSKCGVLRKYLNLMITFLVSGIWHGASFTFIVWGLLHGVYQCVADMLIRIKTCYIEKSDRDNDTKRVSQSLGLKKVFGIVVSFVLVSFAWMFFRANSLSDAKYIVMNMFRGDNFYGQMLQMGFLTVSAYVSVILIILLTIVYDVLIAKMDVMKKFSELNAAFRWGLYIVFGILVVVLYAHNGAGNDFIYFQF